MTILETPPMMIVGMVGYVETPRGLRSPLSPPPPPPRSSKNAAKMKPDAAAPTTTPPQNIADFAAMGMHAPLPLFVSPSPSLSLPPVLWGDDEVQFFSTKKFRFLVST